MDRLVIGLSNMLDRDIQQQQLFEVDHRVLQENIPLDPAHGKIEFLDRWVLAGVKPIRGSVIVHQAGTLPPRCVAVGSNEHCRNPF